MNEQTVPATKNYVSPAYMRPDVLSSVGVQMQLCGQTGTTSFIEVGSGARLLTWLLQQNGFTAHSVDIDVDFGPDIVAALPRIPLKDSAVETSLCFQVLEHMPFEQLGSNLAELARIASRYVIISLPDFNRPRLRTLHTPLSIRVKHVTKIILGYVPFAPDQWKRLRMKKPRISPHHFWEINYAGVTDSDVIAVAESVGLRLVNRLHNEYHSYHYFFVFEKTG